MQLLYQRLVNPYFLFETIIHLFYVLLVQIAEAKKYIYTEYNILVVNILV